MHKEFNMKIIKVSNEQINQLGNLQDQLSQLEQEYQRSKQSLDDQYLPKINNLKQQINYMTDYIQQFYSDASVPPTQVDVNNLTQEQLQEMQQQLQQQ
ncbi:MAG: hypothetical protein ACOCUI_01005 [bacterium]